MVTVSMHEMKARAETPEGQCVTMSVEKLFAGLNRVGMDTAGVVMPDGFKTAVALGRAAVLVHQTPPRVHNLKWIEADSPAPHGPSATYRNVRVALPYVIVLALFVEDRRGAMHLSDANECFFRTGPLGSVDDDLLYPALLNCSRFDPPEGKPLSWICTQYLDRAKLLRQRDLNTRMRVSIKALLHCLLETGFNYSSEEHELNSWFSESVSVDPRVAKIENWEAATSENPMFVLEVPWIPVEMSVGQVARRMLDNAEVSRPRVRSASDVARHILHHGEPE